LFAPGIGGYIGSLIGGFVVAAGSAYAVDYLIDGSSYSLEKYEEQNVSDCDKEKSYVFACEIIGVSASAKRDKIKKEVAL
jgi:hypothetical protein